MLTTYAGVALGVFGLGLQDAVWLDWGAMTGAACPTQAAQLPGTRLLCVPKAGGDEALRQHWPSASSAVQAVILGRLQLWSGRCGQQLRWNCGPPMWMNCMLECLSWTMGTKSFLEPARAADSAGTAHNGQAGGVGAMTP